MVAGSSIPRPAPARIPSFTVALSLFSEATAHRAELAGLELAEARDHALHSTVLAVVTGALVILTGFSLTLLAAALVWDSPHRHWWLGAMVVLYAGVTLALFFNFLRRIRAWRPLEETSRQLKSDCQCLQHLLHEVTH
jgi:uncharacterized membrane protein YqjE